MLLQATIADHSHYFNISEAEEFETIAYSEHCYHISADPEKVDALSDEHCSPDRIGCVFWNINHQPFLFCEQEDDDVLVQFLGKGVSFARYNRLSSTAGVYA